MQTLDQISEGADFGAFSQEQVDALNKALTVGAAMPGGAGGTPGDAYALRVESLDQTLRITTHKAENVKLWKAIGKSAATNTIEQFNELSSYGQNTDSAWLSEGGLPEESDSTYLRRYNTQKFMGTLRRISLQSTMIKAAHGPVKARETVNGTLYLLKAIERALFFADSSLSDVQFDGYEKQMQDRSPASNLLDLRGAPLSEDVLTDAALIAQDAPNYGQLTHMYGGPKYIADLCKTFFPKERYDLLTKPENGMVGLSIKGFTSPAGPIQFVPDVFVDDGGGIPAAAVGNATTRPGTPTQTTGATTPGDALSKFVASDVGDYRLSVVACNRYGKSAALAIASGAGVAVAAGDKITFGVTPAGDPLVEWYEIFRTPLNGLMATARLVKRQVAAAANAETVISEYNDHIPGCQSVFLFQQNVECMEVKQLSPMIKLPLAVIDTNERWLQLVFLSPFLYTPGKVILIKNCGRASGSLV